MKKITRDRIAAMNIQYKYYPLARFLDDAVRSGLACVELWGGAAPAAGRRHLRRGSRRP